MTREELAQDKAGCRKIGPCGVGSRALYLNSFFLDRRYYVLWQDVRRVFKRVAMSKGGFTGRGVFGSMAYLVVELANGQTVQCNFKFENQVDQLLAEIAGQHSHIPIHSREAERRLAKALAEEKAQYVDKLPAGAQEAVSRLEEAKSFLEKKPEQSAALAYTAREKRVWEQISPGYKAFACVIAAASAAAVVFGLWAVTAHKGFALYFVLFGFAFLLLVVTTRVMPTASHNRRALQRDYDEAVSMMKSYLSGYPGGEEAFPVPARYAHPVVLQRMIRLIKKGKAISCEEALEAAKTELKGLTKEVQVSQAEYDEVVTVKPMFRVTDYE